MLELYGGYRIVGGQFVFTSPAIYPSVPQALVTEIQFEPFPPDRPDGSGVTTLSSATNAYPFAVVTVTYRIRFGESRGDLPGVPNGTFLTFDADLGLESHHTPGRVWVWSAMTSDPVPGDINPGILIPAEEFTLTWHRVPRPPWDAIRDLRGKVNDSAFLNHLSGAVLFTGARTARDFQIIDTGLWRLAYQFRVKEVESTAAAGVLGGWNRHYREQAISAEHWLEIEDDDGNHPYRSGDFSQLFQFG